MMHRINLVLWMCLLFLLSCSDKEATMAKGKPAQGDGGAVSVNGILATEQEMSDEFKATGTVMANEEVELKSEVAGKISGIYFREGAMVNKGQVLVKLNDDDLQAQLRKMNIELKLLEIQESRQKQLLAASAISREEYDVTKTNLDLLKANMDILQTQIAKTSITAPFQGIIGLKTVSPGAFITSNTSIATIQNINPLKIEFSIPEKVNSLLRSGSIVRFTTVGSSQENLATVYAKEPKIDAITRTARVRATFANKSATVSPGSFADVRVQLGQKTKGILVPTYAYIPDINGARVFLCKGGKATPVQVVAGIRTEKEIQIIEGITPGDTIITSGILQLKPDMPVQVSLPDQNQ